MNQQAAQRLPASPLTSPFTAWLVLGDACWGESALSRPIAPSEQQHEGLGSSLGFSLASGKICFWQKVQTYVWAERAGAITYDLQR